MNISNNIKHPENFKQEGGKARGSGLKEYLQYSNQVKEMSVVQKFLSENNNKVVLINKFFSKYVKWFKDHEKLTGKEAYQKALEKIKDMKDSEIKSELHKLLEEMSKKQKSTTQKKKSKKQK